MYRLCSVNLDNCRVLHLEINQRVDGRSASPHGIQQKLCRDFLSEFADLGTLVAPRRDLKEIMIVGRADFVSNSSVKFQHWLREQCVTVKSVDSADTFSLEECLRYSLFVWLESQQYYRCGKALIKGPFLCTDPSTVVRILFVVHCTSTGEIFLRISPETVRLFPLECWQVQDCSIETRWVYCLPKLGRGQVVARYSNLPPDSAFANYAEMRAYWKNCYGYDLPLKEPANYYDLWFNGIRSSFLYPDFCVLSSEPQPVGFLEEQATTLAAMSAFMQSFSSEEHFICGEYCGLFPSDSKFLKPHGRALKTTPYSRRAAPNEPISLSEGHAVATSKQEQQEICTGAEDGTPSPTKRLAVETNTGICHVVGTHLPASISPSKSRIALGEPELPSASPKKTPENSRSAPQRLLSSQCFTTTVRGRKRCIDIE